MVKTFIAIGSHLLSSVIPSISSKVTLSLSPNFKIPAVVSIVTTPILSLVIDLMQYFKGSEPFSSITVKLSPKSTKQKP